MIFAVLKSHMYPCPRTHFLHVKKLAEGFIQRGYHFTVLDSLRELDYLSTDDILYISNHFSTEKYLMPLRNILLENLLNSLHVCRAQKILWNFHTCGDPSLFDNFSKDVLHLGEDIDPLYLRKEPLLQNFREKVDVHRLKYGAPLHPDSVDFSVPIHNTDMNFIGAGYKRHLTEHARTNYNSIIYNTPPKVSEPLRINSFKNARLNLVFHSDSNIEKGIIVERFAEALAYGNFIAHDHPHIEELTKGFHFARKVQHESDIDLFISDIKSMSSFQKAGAIKQARNMFISEGFSYYAQADSILQKLRIDTKK